MARPDGYKYFILDQLAALQGVTCRAMFGGYGLTLHNVFFGIVHKGRLYFKTHPETVQVYLAKRMQAFKPNPKQTLKNYFEVPIEVIESAEDWVQWAQRAAQP